MKGTSFPSTRRSRAGSRRRRCSMAMAAGPPSSHTARTPGSTSAGRLPPATASSPRRTRIVHVAAHDPAHPRQQHRIARGGRLRQQLDRQAVAFEHERQVVLDDLLQARHRRQVGAVGDGANGHEELGLEAVHQAEQQGLLGREVPVDGRFGEPDAGRDALHGQVAQAGLGGQFAGAVEDLLAAGGGGHADAGGLLSKCVLTHKHRIRLLPRRVKRPAYRLHSSAGVHPVHWSVGWRLGQGSCQIFLRGGVRWPKKWSTSCR